MEEKIITIKNEEETRAFGGRLAEEAKPGDGDRPHRRSGYRQDYADQIYCGSPWRTGSYHKPYIQYREGIQDWQTCPCIHFDVYRITDPDEMYELGYEEYFYGDGVCIIEWADLIEELLPEHTIRIEIQYGENEGERIYRCTF